MNPEGGGVRETERVHRFYGFMHIHLLRDPLDYLGAVGFQIEHCERSKGGLVEQAVATKEA